MAWADPMGWPVALLVDDDTMNNHISGNLNHLYDAPICKITHSTTQTATNGDETNLAFDTDVDDPDGMHSTSVNTDRIFWSRTGLWAVVFRAALAADADGWRYLRVENTPLISQIGLAGSAGSEYVLHLSGLVHVTSATGATADSIRALVSHLAGASLTVSSLPEFEVQWLNGAGT
jgi:hypothetical protein